MAGEPRPPGRSRPTSGASGDDSDMTLAGVDPTAAPITANTPLPPVNLASQAGGGGAAPQPPPGLWPPSTDQSALPPLPPSSYPSQAANAEAPGKGASDSGVTSGWAARTTFVLMLTSAILLAAMAIAYTTATKKDGLLIWVVVIIVVVNIVYPLIVFSIARPGSAGPMRLPFMPPRRGP